MLTGFFSGLPALVANTAAVTALFTVLGFGANRGGALSFLPASKRFFKLLISSAGAASTPPLPALGLPGRLPSGEILWAGGGLLRSAPPPLSRKSFVRSLTVPREGSTSSACVSDITLLGVEAREKARLAARNCELSGLVGGAGRRCGILFGELERGVESPELDHRWLFGQARLVAEEVRWMVEALGDVAVSLRDWGPVRLKLRVAAARAAEEEEGMDIEGNGNRGEERGAGRSEPEELTPSSAYAIAEKVTGLRAWIWGTRSTSRI